MPLVNVLRNANKSLFGERPIIRPLRVEFLAVAGGGGGNQGESIGNGGGAGGVITGSFCVQRDETYDIIVGDGGAPVGPSGQPPSTDAGYRGGNTVLFGVIAIGGGGASATNGSNTNDRNDGGSGGGENCTDGVSCPAGVGLQPTASYSGFGNDGGVGVQVGGVGGAGGGGGAGGAGSNANAGAGIQLDFLNDYTVGSDPTKRLFAQGGSGAQINQTGAEAPSDDGPQPRFPTYGKGGRGGFTQTAGSSPPRDAVSGSSGAVFIRYKGAPILQGGDSVVTNNGYTYHVFDSVGTGSLSFIPGKNQDNFAIDNCNDPLTIPIT